MKVGGERDGAVAGGLCRHEPEPLETGHARVDIRNNDGKRGAARPCKRFAINRADIIHTRVIERGGFTRINAGTGHFEPDFRGQLFKDMLDEPAASFSFDQATDEKKMR